MISSTYEQCFRRISLFFFRESHALNKWIKTWLYISPLILGSIPIRKLGVIMIGKKKEKILTVLKLLRRVYKAGHAAVHWISCVLICSPTAVQRLLCITIWALTGHKVWKIYVHIVIAHLEFRIANGYTVIEKCLANKLVLYIYSKKHYHISG